MSNSISSAINTTQKHGTTMPRVPAIGGRQKMFEGGTQQLLDEARNVTENAVGQGQDLNPMIYQMLGLQPEYEDHSDVINQAQSEFDAASKQATTAQQTLAQLRAIPMNQRSPAQRQQLRQLKRQLPQLNRSMEQAQNSLGQLQTMPKTIKSLTRMDPSQIPANSPYSPQNPLNQAASSEASRLDQYLSGTAAVDPTLVHQYTQAEAALKSQLAAKYGPDYANSSVGQMALANFDRQKNEAFATWNQQMVERYHNLAFQGQANLQNLTANQIALMREPSNWAMGAGGTLSNLAAQRLTEQQTFNQRLGLHTGLSENVSTAAPVAGPIAGGIGSLLTTPTGGGSTVGGSLYNWATGGGGAGTAAGAGTLAGTEGAAGSIGTAGEAYAVDAGASEGAAALL